MSFEAFAGNIPLIHTWDRGANWNSGGFERQDLEALHAFLRPRVPEGAVFLETGAGLSTVTLLSLNPSKLISIAPEADLFDRIRASCREFGISDAPLEAIVEGSQWALPVLAATHRHTGAIFDFFLIDGCHGWPTAFVDLEYGNAMLKQGGYLMIDDVQLHSLKEMARMLADHEAFCLEFDMGKALIFRKTKDHMYLGEWTEQGYIVKKTEEFGRNPNQYALSPPNFSARISYLLRQWPGRIASRFAKS